MPADYGAVGVAVWIEATWMVMTDGTVRRHDEAEARRIFARGVEDHILEMHVAMVSEMLSRHPARQFTGSWWNSERQAWCHGDTLSQEHA